MSYQGPHRCQSDDCTCWEKPSFPDGLEGRGPTTQPLLEQSETPRVRRVLYADDPREEDYRKAQAELESIRDEMGRLRSRLRGLAKIEADFWFDSLANNAAGALSLSIMALYELVSGERSFAARADRSRDLWADVEAHPEFYLVKEGPRP